jgi:hypothetical protein
MQLNQQLTLNKDPYQLLRTDVDFIITTEGHRTTNHIVRFESSEFCGNFRSVNS